MQAQRWIANRQRLRAAKLLARQVKRIATHRKPQMPQMGTVCKPDSERQ
jgi:hypothetical protein